MGKRNQSKSVKVVLLAAGIVFICASIYFLFHGIYSYAKQFDQRDWKTTTATVVNVDRRRNGHHRNYRYDIYYQYEAGGNVYNGAIYGINAPRKVGKTFDVKYDPEAPQDSTQYLEPTFGIVVSGLLGLVIFGGIGLRMVKNALPKSKNNKKKRNKKPTSAV